MPVLCYASCSRIAVIKHRLNMSPKDIQLRARLKALYKEILDNNQRGELMRAAGATAVFRIGASLLAFAASLLYARVLGPHDYGLYAYVIAWTSVLAIPASLGIPRYLVREGAKQPESIRWLRRWADGGVLVTGLLAAMLLISAFFMPVVAGTGYLFAIAAPLPLLHNLIGIRVSLLQAQGQIIQSQWPQLVLGPSLMLVVLVGLWLWRGELSALDLVVVLMLTTLTQLAVNDLCLRFSAGYQVARQQGSAQIKHSLSFMWLGMLFLINSRTDLIMLGTLSGAESAGVYAIATRMSEFIPFILVAANTVIAPRIARLHQQGNRALLQRLITGAASRVFYITLPIALLFTIFSQPLMQHLFGADFTIGSTALQILVTAQLFSVLAGPTGVILNMTGHENLAAAGVGISALINIVLNSALIPLFDLTGAAIATGTSLVIWNSLLWYWIRHRLNLHPSAVGY